LLLRRRLRRFVRTWLLWRRLALRAEGLSAAEAARRFRIGNRHAESNQYRKYCSKYLVHRSSALRESKAGPF
jgi:hypothetical protein